MATKTLAAAALAATILSVTPALADNTGTTPTTTLWRTLQYWTIRIDPTYGNGCFVQATYTDGTVFRMGLDLTKSPALGYLLVFNKAWGSLTPGQTYPVQVKFDNVQHSGWSTWNATASMMGDGTTHALELSFANPEVLVATAIGSGIHLMYEGRAILNSTLPGSQQAVAEMAACQKAYGDASGGAVSDPFRGSGQPPHRADPFQPL